MLCGWIYNSGLFLNCGIIFDFFCFPNYGIGGVGGVIVIVGFKRGGGVFYFAFKGCYFSIIMGAFFF